MDCLDDGIEAWVAMDMARFFNRNHGAESHRLLSLQKPTSEGLRRAELLGVEVDSGSGCPFSPIISSARTSFTCTGVHPFHGTLSFHGSDFERLLLWNHRLGHQRPTV